MNKILQDLINTEEVVSFIDNVIVEIEGRGAWWSGGKSNKNTSRKWLIYEIRCKWKVRNVGFLGVVIGLEGIKIEE